MLPLTGINVLEIPHDLAVRSAGLRLADLGARVVQMAVPDARFEIVERNRLWENPDGEKIISRLRQADIVLLDRRCKWIDEQKILEINPNVILGVVSELATRGPWKNLACNDLQAQSISGLVHLTGNQDDPPTPFAIPIAELLAGAHLVQGVLAVLRKNQAAVIEVSLLESLIDFQFEVITTHFADGGRLPLRSKQFNAHAYLSAPYGIYPAKEGFIALGMGDVAALGEKLGSVELAQHHDSQKWFVDRDLIQSELAECLKEKSAKEWLAILEPQDVWCAEVLTLDELKKLPGYQVLQMDQAVKSRAGETIQTTRCAIRIDGQRLFQSEKPVESAGKPIARIKQLGRPLDGITVIDFSQFLSGPCASLRLADLGARVIKVEKPIIGDICRQLYVSDTRLDGESTTFHAINRNKESYVADLKLAAGVSEIKSLLAKADVMIHNFRPGVIERLGFSYEAVKQINPKIVFAAISGYGTEGPWKDKPGQDLLVQAISGLATCGSSQPVAMGLSVVDQMAGMNLVHGILSLLHRRNQTQTGGRVDVSMLETAIDLQLVISSPQSVKKCFTWSQLLNDPGFEALEMSQVVRRGSGATYRTTRCPISLDGKLLLSEKGSPDLGEDTEVIKTRGL